MLLLYIKGIKLNIIRLKIPNIVVDSVIEQVMNKNEKNRYELRFPNASVT